MENENENPDAAAEQSSEETDGLKAKIGELERVLGEKDDEITTLRKDMETSEEQRRSFESSLAEAVGSYRTLVMEYNPVIPGEFITGDNIDAVNESLNKAKDLISLVKKDLGVEISGMKIPAGAPERSAPDLSGLSAGEKIRYALGGNE